jgi:hypothetical protein
MIDKPAVSEETLQGLVNAVEGIVSSRIRMDDKGNVTEIHAIAKRSRNAKQIARDIQSAVSAAFAVDIDHRVISIAQLDGEGFSSDGLRFAYKGMEIVRKDLNFEVKITLAHRGEIFVGCHKGANTIGSINRSIAEAVLKAVLNALGSEDMFVIEDVGSLTIAGFSVVNAAVTYLDKKGGRLLIGTAVNGGDMKEAVAKATLDAVNRKIVNLLET